MSETPTGHEHERAVATSVVVRLRDSGHEAWFVGGCVREMLRGGSPADFDVTTSATPDQVAALFERVVEVGRQFGVVMVVQDEVVIEVATFRTEGSYTDGRRPDSIRFATAREDVARRDFTVNALLYDPVTSQVLDFVGGLEDLRRGVLRTVGDPRERLLEDRLRMLRAARFTARLGFALDPGVRAACLELAPLVTSVSVERIRDELDRMLGHPTRGAAIRLLGDLGLLEHVLPEVNALGGVLRASCCEGERSVLDHVFAAVDRLRPEASLEAAWATLLHDAGWAEPAGRAEGADGLVVGEAGAAVARRLALRLRMSTRSSDRIVELVRRHREVRGAESLPLASLRRLLALPLLEDLLDLARAEGEAHDGLALGVDVLENARPRWGTTLPPPLVSGTDLLAAGVARGPRIGEILATLREEQLEERLASRDDALARARRLAGEASDPSHGARDAR